MKDDFSGFDFSSFSASQGEEAISPSKDAKTEKQPGDKKKKAARREASNIPPVLEWSLTISKLLVLVAGLATALLSVLAGANVLAVALRSAGVILSAGLLLWLANYLFARQLAELTVEESKKKQDQPAESMPPNFFDLQV